MVVPVIRSPITATAITDAPTDGAARTHHQEHHAVRHPPPRLRRPRHPAGHVRFVAAERTDTAVEVRPANVKLALTGMA